MKKYAPLFIVAAAFLWSTDTLLRKPLTEEISATTIVFFEHLFGVILLLPIFFYGLKQLRSFTQKEWFSILFIALGGSALATVFFTTSFNYVSPSVSILLQKIQPIFTILLAALILKEGLIKRYWFWAGLAIIGAYFVSFPEITPTLSLYEGGFRGILYALIAAFFWGGSTVFGRIVLKKVEFKFMTSLRLTFALFFLFIMLIWQGELGGLGGVTLHNIWYLVLITLIPGTLALLLYYRGLKHTKASVSTIAELFWPLSAVILNWIFLGEVLNATQIIGGVVLVFAIWRVALLNLQIKEKRIDLQQAPNAEENRV